MLFFIDLPLTNRRSLINTTKSNTARVAELADALDLGSSAFVRGGSTPPSRTRFSVNKLPVQTTGTGSIEEKRSSLDVQISDQGRQPELRYLSQWK
jgi:hypothetical protein